MVGDMVEVLRGYGIEGGRVIVEVRERGGIEEGDGGVGMVGGVGNGGVGVGVDDLGMG